MSEYRCFCYRCASEDTVGMTGLNAMQHMSMMFLCSKCGNKRCPRATDHRLFCTNSNEPGQPGSNYAAPTPPPPAGADDGIA